MKRKLFLHILIGLIFLQPWAGWGQGKLSSLPSSLAFGTSSVGSSMYVMSVGMANLITKKAGINMTAESVGGSDANVRALKEKKIDLAMLNSLSLANAYLGIEPYTKMGKIPLRVLVQGQERYSYIIVRKASGVKTPADLRGKKFIGKRRALVDIEMVTSALLKAYNIPKEAVKVLETAETNEAVEALKTGAVDGAIIPGGMKASNLMELARDIDLTFLSIPDDKFQLMSKDLGAAFLKGVVPAGVYKGQNQVVQAPLLLLCVAVQAGFQEDLSYTITKTLMENQEALQAIHSTGKEWTMENTLKSPPAPFHPGAVKYFKEKGVWDANLEQIQQQLLKLGGS